MCVVCVCCVCVCVCVCVRGNVGLKTAIHGSKCAHIGGGGGVFVLCSHLWMCKCVQACTYTIVGVYITCTYMYTHNVCTLAPYITIMHKSIKTSNKCN